MRDNNAISDSSQLQVQDGKEDSNLSKGPRMKKFNFYGFRSPFPIYRNRDGLITAEKLFASESFEDSSSEFPYCFVSEDVAKMDFAFRPVIDIISKSVPQQEAQGSAVPCCKKSLPCVSKKLLKKQNLKNPKKKKPLNFSARNKVDGQKAKLKVAKHSRNTRSTVKETDSDKKSTNLRPSNTVQRKNKLSTSSSVKKVLHKNNRKAASTKSIFVPRKPSRTIVCEPEGSERPSDAENIVPNSQLEAGASRIVTPKLKINLKKSATQSTSYDIMADSNPVASVTPENDGKRVDHKISFLSGKTKQTLQGTKSTVNNGHRISVSSLQLNKFSNKSVNKDADDINHQNIFQHKVNNRRNARFTRKARKNVLKVNQFQNLQPQNLYYPVHPYTSPDLPIHFIPVDPNNIPDFLPLFSPVTGKNNSQVFPSFVQVVPIPKKVPAPEYVFSKAIHSKSIPRQTLPAEEVIPKVLRGIASTSKSPILPGLNSFRKVGTQSVVSAAAKTIDQNSDLEENSTTSSLSSSIQGTMNNSFNDQNSYRRPRLSDSSVTDQPFPDSLTSTEDVQQKIHKCIKCTFQTPKLGILKRHELSSHSKSDSYKESNDDVVILDSKFPSKENPGPSMPTILSSVKINTTQAQVLRTISSQCIQPSEENDTGLKIVSTESLKETIAGRLDNFHQFLSSSNNGSLQKLFPSVTITPLVQSCDDD